MQYAMTIHNIFGLSSTNSQGVKLIRYLVLPLVHIHDNITNVEYHF
jgi:hypothetical protein